MRRMELERCRCRAGRPRGRRRRRVRHAAAGLAALFAVHAAVDGSRWRRWKHAGGVRAEQERQARWTTACGVFVAASGDDAATGTKAAPVKTIQQAVALAQQESTARRVCACAETFEGQVEVPGGVALFGGLDCSNGWGWIGETAKTTLTAPEGEIRRDARRRRRGPRRGCHVTARAIDPEQRGSAGPVVHRRARRGRRRRDGALHARGGRCGRRHRRRGVPQSRRSPASRATRACEACSGREPSAGDVKRNECGTPDDLSDEFHRRTGGIGQLDSGGDGGSAHAGGAQKMAASDEHVHACTSRGTAGAEGTAG